MICDPCQKYLSVVVINQNLSTYLAVKICIVQVLSILKLLSFLLTIFLCPETGHWQFCNLYPSRLLTIDTRKIFQAKKLNKWPHDKIKTQILDTCPWVMFGLRTLYWEVEIIRAELIKSFECETVKFVRSRNISRKSTKPNSEHGMSLDHVIY